MKSDEETRYLARRQPHALLSWKQKISIALSPSAPLPQPKTVPDLEHLPVLERVSETLRYSISHLEYNLSPNGGLRQWLKINISFLILLGIPILLFAPLLTFFMVEFTSITAYFLRSVLNIFLSVLALAATVSLLWGGYKLIVFLRYSEKRVKEKRDEEYRQIEREARQKREEEFRRLEYEFQQRRKEEYTQIESDVRRRQEEERQRVDAEIRQKRSEELQRIDTEFQQKRTRANQQLEKDSLKRQEEEQQKIEAEVQRIVHEERQKLIRETRKNIQAWKAQLHIYDQCCESPIEAQFWEVAKHRLLGLIPQYDIGRYRVDFALPDEHLVIELDGHDYHKTKEQRTRDAKRERDLQELGWYVIRFTGTEVYRNIEQCIEQVERICQTFIEEERNRQKAKF